MQFGRLTHTKRSKQSALSLRVHLRRRTLPALAPHDMTKVSTTSAHATDPTNTNILHLVHRTLSHAVYHHADQQSPPAAAVSAATATAAAVAGQPAAKTSTCLGDVHDFTLVEHVTRMKRLTDHYMHAPPNCQVMELSLCMLNKIVKDAPAGGSSPYTIVADLQGVKGIWKCTSKEAVHAPVARERSQGIPCAT